MKGNGTLQRMHEADKTMDEQLTNRQEAVYRDFYEKVFRMILAKVCNETLAEDLAENVFVKVYANWDHFDENRASLSTWIYRIAQNTVIDYYRTRKVHAEVPEDLASESAVDDELLKNETLELLADALEKLPERDRDLVILHYYRGLTLKEVAMKMGMSYSNAKLVHNKALAALKKLLDGVV